MSHQNSYNHGKALLAGEWNPGVTWSFHAANRLPPGIPCTAVGCAAIADITEGTVLLTENTRAQTQWETPAGHTDPLDKRNPDGPRENPEQTIRREVLEEVGGKIARLGLYGYRLIEDAARHGADRQSIMPYYWAILHPKLVTPTDPKHTAPEHVTPDRARELVRLGFMNPIEWELVWRGLAAAPLRLRQGVRLGN